MDIASVMDELAARLETIDGWRVHSLPPGTVVPPALVVSYPEEYVFDRTYGRGTDAIQLPVAAMVGKVIDRSTRDLLAAICGGAGVSSVKQVLEGYNGNYASFDFVHVTGVEFDVMTHHAVDYMAAIFTLQIIGPGSA